MHFRNSLWWDNAKKLASRTHVMHGHSGQQAAHHEDRILAYLKHHALGHRLDTTGAETLPMAAAPRIFCRVVVR
eukprot:12415966-Karenia_brevis.AAC.1